MENIKRINKKYNELSEVKRLLSSKLKDSNGLVGAAGADTQKHYLDKLSPLEEKLDEVTDELEKIKVDFITDLSNMLKKEIGESSSDLFYEVLADYGYIYTR